MANIGKCFTVSNVYFVDKGGNRVEITNAVFPVQSNEESILSVVYGGPIKAEWTFTVVTREAFNDLLLIVDPREWVRRNWWKLPVLWERK